MRNLLIPILVFLAGDSAADAQNDPLIAKLDAGTVSGMAGASADMRIFKGIPFAAPPVGDLRWRAPQPVAHWTGVRKANAFGPSCMQGNGNAGNSEDCLYLNVWTAGKAGEKRPVMVWIHGGGYYAGSGSQSMYDGEALAKKGAVVVTLNYRLGVFGFFSYPELTKESDRRGAANFGAMDSIAVLEWVQKNITQFGGDPKRVTIFGESAGSAMVANLMVMPKAKGLFQRAIGESGAWSTASVRRLKTLPEAEQDGVKFAEGVGAKSLAELRAKPADVILKGGRGEGPIVDGWLIPEDPSTVFAAGKQTDVPVLTGSNRDESSNSNPQSSGEFVEQARKRFGDMADQYLKVYPAGSDGQARESAFLTGRDQMAFAMRNWARLAARPGKSKSYVYYFTQQRPLVPGGKEKGQFAPGPHGSATHVSEILYVFNHLDNSRPWTDADRQGADMMSSYWVNFATNGDPNGKGLPKWPVFDGNTGTTMIFGNAPQGSQVPGEAQLAFFKTYFLKS